MSTFDDFTSDEPTLAESSRAFELTDIWTPECSSIFQFEETSTASCEPPNFDSIWAYDGYYSPGICFSGYTAGCELTWRDIEPGQTAYNCVPSGWDCSTYTFQAVSINSDGEELSVPALEIRWESSDLPFLETHPLTPELATVTDSETGSSDPESRSTAELFPGPTDSSEISGGGVPTSAVIGIAVGVAVFVAVVCAAAFVWYRKRHKATDATPSLNASVGGKPGGLVVYGGPPVTGALSHFGAPSVPGPPGAVPTELAGAHYHTEEGAVELHGRDLLPELPPAEAASNGAGGSSPSFQIPRRQVGG